MILAFTNQKGGVGKTTSALHTVWAARKRGLRVGLVDIDPQGNATTTLTGQELQDMGGASALFEAGAVLEWNETQDGIFVLPADKALADVDGLGMDVAELPRKHLQSADFDLIVLDCPPSLGLRLIGALIAADGAVTPIRCDTYSLEGVEALLETFAAVRNGPNPDLRILGLVPNLINSTSGAQRRRLKQLREDMGDAVFDTVLHHRAAVGDAIDEGRAVWRFANTGARARAALEMKAFTTELFARAGL